jgi:hypothetical protein
MIKQNDLQLNRAIQSYGCNFMCHIMLANGLSHFSAAEVLDLYKNAVAKKLINDNCRVDGVNALIELATPDDAPILRQIGGINLATGETWGVSSSHAKVQYAIARWSTHLGGNNYHFSLHNRNGEIYDPYDAATASYRLEKRQCLGYQFYG